MASWREDCYDLAVRSDRQRQGIGRRLIAALRAAAAAAGIEVVFVPADEDDDVHALEFYRALGGEPAPVTIFTFFGDEGSNEETHEPIHGSRLGARRDPLS